MHSLCGLIPYYMDIIPLAMAISVHTLLFHFPRKIIIGRDAYRHALTMTQGLIPYYMDMIPLPMATSMYICTCIHLFNW